MLKTAARLLTAPVSAFIAIWTIGESSTFVRAEVLPRFQVTERHHIEAKPVEAATTVVMPSARDAGIPVYAFDRALNQCKLTHEEVAELLNKALAPDSPVWRAINHLIIDAAETIRELQPTIVIDDFEGKQAVFASFYAHPTKRAPGGVIGLDCHPRSREYWAASIAHEFTHALLHRLTPDIESWFEDGLAQLIESEAGGTQPELSARTLETVAPMPTLLEQTRPLPERANYALGYLFSKYLLERWGGWKTLIAMSGTQGWPAPCGHERRFFARAVCAASLRLKDSQRLAPLAHKMTPIGILRFFFVALAMHHPTFGYYSIPGWNGFDPQTIDTVARITHETQILPETVRLQAGQALVLPGGTKVVPELLSDGVEAYRVTANAREYRVTPLRESKREEVPLTPGIPAKGGTPPSTGTKANAGAAATAVENGETSVTAATHISENKGAARDRDSGVSGDVDFVLLIGTEFEEQNAIP